MQNFLLLILIARSTGTVEFGRYSLYSLVALLLSGALQACICDLAMLELPRSNAPSPTAWAALVWGMGLATAVSGLAVLVAIAFADPIESEVLAMATTFPALVLMDILRHIAAAYSRGSISLAGDGIWVALWLASVIVLHPMGMIAHIYAYGAASILGSCMIFTALWRERLLRPLPIRVDELQRAKVAAMFREYVSVAAGGFALTAGLGVTLGVQVVGAIRAAQGLMGPLNAVATAIRLTFTAPLSRSVVHHGALSRRDTLPLVLSMSALGLIAVVGSLVLPDSLGVLLLGDSWVAAGSVLFLVSLQRLVTAPILATTMAHRANGNVAWVADVKSRYSLLTTIAVLLTSVNFGLHGSLWVWAIGCALQTAHIFAALPTKVRREGVGL